MRSAQQRINNQSAAVPLVLESTSSGCSTGASPNLDTYRDAFGAKLVVPSPPALPSSAVSSAFPAQQSLALGTRLASPVNDQHLLMATQQLQQQQLQFLQANVQRLNEGRMDALSAGAAMVGPNIATCKQSSSSSFNGSPSTNASAALEPREEPMLPSTRASDTGMAANRVLRLVQHQQQPGQQPGQRCPTPQQHQLPPQVPGSLHQGDEEVASQQQGRVVQPLRLENAGGASTGAAIAAEGDTAGATTSWHDAHKGRPRAGSLGWAHAPEDAMVAGSSAQQLPGRVPSPLMGRAEGLGNGTCALTAQRVAQLQQQQQLASMQAPQRIHPSPAGASAGGAAMGAPAAQAQQLRQLQQQLQMRQRLQQQQMLQQQQQQQMLQQQQQQQMLQQQQQQQQMLQQQQAEMQLAAQQQQQQQLRPLGAGQQQLASCGSMSSTLVGGPDRMGGGAAAGIEAQVRARLGLPPKRINSLGHTATSGGHGGLGACGFSAVGGSPSVMSAAGHVATCMSDNRLGPDGPLAQHVRMRFMAVASSQTSSPNMSCSTSQATVTAPPQLPSTGSAPNEAMSGGAAASDLLLGSSPAIFPSQHHHQQRRHQHELMQQQQRLSVRQALLRGSTSALVTQAGGPFAAAAAAAAALGGGASASLGRSSSAPQAALETQVAAARLRKLEQMGISPSQAVLAVAAGGRFSGMQPQLACRTSVGYAAAGPCSNPTSEGGSPMSSRSFKRSAAERCWEEQHHLKQQQLQQLQQLQQQQQHIQMQALTGLASEGSASAGAGRHGGAGAGYGAGDAPEGDALQAMKRSRAYGAEMMSSAPAGPLGFASQTMQRFDSVAQQQQQAVMMCRSMPEDIHSIAMISGNSGGVGGSLPGMDLLPGGNMAAPQMPSHMGGGDVSLSAADDPGAGMGMVGLGGCPLDGSGAMGMLGGGANSLGPIGGGAGGMDLGPMAGGGMNLGPMGTAGIGMGGMSPGGIGLVQGDTGAAMALGGGAGGRPSLGCGDGLGPTPMIPRCFDTAMAELAELGPETDYLADTELQSFIAELCAPASGPGQQDPLTGAAVSMGGSPAGAGPGGGAGAQSIDVAMSEGAGGGGGSVGGRAAAAEGPVAVAAGSGRCTGAGQGGGAAGPFGHRQPQIALDEEQRALQTEAEALLNFRFD